MAYFSYSSGFARHALLVCDECDRVLTSEGKLSGKRRSDSTPDELAPHFRERADLSRPAIEAGWRARIAPPDTHAHWTCPECARGE